MQLGTRVPPFPFPSLLLVVFHNVEQCPLQRVSAVTCELLSSAHFLGDMFCQGFLPRDSDVAWILAYVKALAGE